MQRMTLKMLADHLCLSPTTVSRALNGYSDVSEQTRNRVEKAANEHGYRPNANARRLATGKSNVIGFAFPSELNPLADPHFVEFLAGLSEKVSETDYDILLAASKKGEASIYERFAAKGSVDLVVLSCVDLSEESIVQLKELGLPFIVHGRTEHCSSYPYLDIDNYSVFYQPTRMLVELGHRDIAILNGQEHLVFALYRQQGWEAALREQGVEPRQDFIRNSEMTAERGYALSRGLLEQKDRPTALVCSSTLLAQGAYKAATELGLSIGKDISITAHDDGLPQASAENMDPPLTVTRSTLRDAGMEIANLAIRQIEGAPLSELQILWNAELIYRSSAGAYSR